jgi:hypothetical protein
MALQNKRFRCWRIGAGSCEKRPGKKKKRKESFDPMLFECALRIK